MKQSFTLLYLSLKKARPALTLLLLAGWLPLSSYAQTWSAQNLGTLNTLQGVWGADASNVWVVDNVGNIQKWNGSTWDPEDGFSTPGLRRVWGADANNVWAVGSGGTILKRNSIFWDPENSGTISLLRGVWGADANNVWAVGSGGTILKRNSSTWPAQTSNTPNPLIGIWGADANNVWAVGATGTIMKWNGSAWSAQTSNTTQQLNGVWGVDAGNVWAVGSLGTILKWNGSSWSAQTSNTTQNLNSVWGIDANNVWAVGTGGTILKWNGSAWSAQTSNTTQNLQGVWGANAGNVWAVGNLGTLLYSNDQPITVLPVELLSFQVKKQSENAVQLLWRTASESNNLGWDIERSADGRQWQSIGFRDGHGSTSEPQSYTFTDDLPLPGRNYYRLRQSDHDGKYEYSEVVQVMMSGIGEQTGAFYPNPAPSGLVSLDYYAEKDGELHVSVFDTHGRLMIRQNQPIAAARNLLQFDFSQLAPGTYSVLLDNGASQVTRTLTIQ